MYDTMSNPNISAMQRASRHRWRHKITANIGERREHCTYCGTERIEVRTQRFDYFSKDGTPLGADNPACVEKTEELYRDSKLVKQILEEPLQRKKKAVRFKDLVNSADIEDSTLPLPLRPYRTKEVIEAEKKPLTDKEVADMIASVVRKSQPKLAEQRKSWEVEQLKDTSAILRRRMHRFAEQVEESVEDEHWETIFILHAVLEEAGKHLSPKLLGRIQDLIQFNVFSLGANLRIEADEKESARFTD